MCLPFSVNHELKLARFIPDPQLTWYNCFGLQAEDNSVSRDELTAVLLSSLESAHTILDNVEDAEQPEEGSGTDKLIETVTRFEALIFQASSFQLLKLKNLL